MYHRNLIFSIKPQIFELKCVFSYFRLKTHITLLLPVYVHSWEQRKFSDLVQIERGGSPRPIDDFITDSPDGLNWVKIGDAPAQGNYITKTAEKIKPEGLSKTREVHPGDLILSNSMSFGKPYIMGIDGCIHDGWLLIRNTYKAFDLTFLCHLLGTPQMIIQYKSLAAGSTVNNLNKELVGNTVVTIPTIKEQRVLGQYLETLDNLITLHQCKCQIDGCRFQSPLAITWEQRKVREVTDRYDNLRIPVAASLRVAGTTPYYGANGIQDYVDGYTHDGEFILVAEDGANDLKNYPVKCVKGRIWVNNHAHVLQGKYDCADNQFLAYAISQADIESLLVGGGRAKLNAETLMGIDLLLPNKAEQIRIGKYLAQLDNLITLHQRKYDKLTNVKKSMLEKMFPQNGSNAPEIRFKGFTEAWEQRKLGDVVDVRSGKDYKHLSEGNIPVYGTGGFMLSVNQALSYDEDAIGIGRKGTIDKPYILKAPFWTVDTLFYAIPREKVDLNFAFDVFQNIDWKKKDESTGVPSLSKTAINEIDVLVPQYDEQQPLGQFFNRIDNLITLHQRELEKLKNLKKACLEKMFV